MMKWLELFRAPKHDVLGINRRNIELVKRKNKRSDFPLVNDKLRAKQILSMAGVPVAPTICVFSSFGDLGRIPEKLEGLDDFVVKPAHGSGGCGILVIVERRDGGFITAGGESITAGEIRRHIADIVFGVYAYDNTDVALVEPRLYPHPFFQMLYKDGLSDIRIIMVDEKPVLSMVRVPTRASAGRANLHQGALGLGVDLDSGTIKRGWYQGRLVEVHPDNGECLLNKRVPLWDTILAHSIAVAKALPLKYLGIDIVVAHELGPLVLEVNVRPGLEIQNVTGLPLRRRLMQIEFGGVTS